MQPIPASFIGSHDKLVSPHRGAAYSAACLPPILARFGERKGRTDTERNENADAVTPTRISQPVDPN